MIAPMNLFANSPLTWVIILVLALVIFGTSRLAGIGKTSGKAIREFREEMDTLKADKADKAVGTGTPATGTGVAPDAQQAGSSAAAPVHEAEVVDPQPAPRPDTRP